MASTRGERRVETAEPSSAGVGAVEGGAVQMPAVQPEAISTRRPWLNVLLVVATLITTTVAGAAHQGVNVLDEPRRWAVGLPYGIGLMLILGVHEMGHYLAARHHRISASLPYFIPVPFALGTDGRRRALAWGTFALLALILVPFPHVLAPGLGLHCPYV